MDRLDQFLAENEEIEIYVTALISVAEALGLEDLSYIEHVISFHSSYNASIC